MNRIVFKSLVLTLICSCAMYISCDKKKLDIPSPTQNESTYFSNESEFQSAIIGVYAKLTDYFSPGNLLSGGSAELATWFLPGDDLSQNGGQVFEFFNGLTAGEPKVEQVFASSYGLIARANKVLDKISLAEAGVFTTPNMKEYNKGEMLFLRSFAHYMLWNLFGTAPVDTAVVTTTEQFTPANSSGTDLLDQAVIDLQEAATLLPASWDNTNVGRVTRNSAFGLLGKILVFRASANKDAADYTAAIAAFNQISGATLLPNFGDNFLIDKENGAESLFEFQAGLNIAGGQNPWLSNETCDCGPTGATYQMFYSGLTSYMSDGVYLPTTKLKNIFEDGDPRFALTLNADSTEINKYTVDGEETSSGVSFNNHRILRLSDVILLKAEAVLQSGGSTSEAIGLINQIRARARNMVVAGTIPADLDAGETNKTTIMQWIMDERLRELAAEGQRWFDMRRWHMAGYITLDNAYFSSAVPNNMEFKVTNLYYPFPESERNRNPNLVQNPGY